MATKTRSKKKASKPGPVIIRAWFDTVINPLLQALKWEQVRLEQKNWTWQIPPGRLESVRPVKDMISPLAEDNLEQFLSFYPALKEQVDFHDTEVTHLEVACRNLQRAIEENDRLREIYRQIRSDESLTPLGETVSGVLRGDSELKHLELLAQYIVNRMDELPDYYVYSPVWNKYRSDLLAILELPDIQQQVSLADHSGDKLLRIDKRLIENLKKTREELSLTHDVPYVAASTVYGE